MARILGTEKIADGGLDLLRDAGHDVDVVLAPTAEELLEVVKGAHALIIRSATTVTAEVLAPIDCPHWISREGVHSRCARCDAGRCAGSVV